MRYAVPELRLPQKVLDEQFSQLRSMGVEIQTDAVFGRTLMIDELFMRGFSAVLLAASASLPLFTDLPGSSLAGVYYDMEFLYRLQTAGKENVLQAAWQQRIPAVCPELLRVSGMRTAAAKTKTVVIGCGSAAFDAARLSLRLGSEVRVIFEGTEEQAGIGFEILKESREEGLELLDSRVLEIVGDDNGFSESVFWLLLPVRNSSA